MYTGCYKGIISFYTSNAKNGEKLENLVLFWYTAYLLQYFYANLHLHSPRELGITRTYILPFITRKKMALFTLAAPDHPILSVYPVLDWNLPYRMWKILQFPRHEPLFDMRIYFTR